MTIQEYADIAARHSTTMAVAMLAACVERHIRTNEPLIIPERKEKKRKRKRRRRHRHEEELSHDEWRVMVEHNRASDATWRE